jgi:hypothetical protein
LRKANARKKVEHRLFETSKKVNQSGKTRSKISPELAKKILSKARKRKTK